MKLKLLAAAVAMSLGSVAGAQVVITGDSTQTTSIYNSTTVNNEARGNNADATQSLASNAGMVRIAGWSDQTVDLDYADILNDADGSGAVAVQNLSSNVGKVSIGGDSEQWTYVGNSPVHNYADGTNAFAAQSLSSNFGDVSIGGSSYQSTDVYDSMVMNKAHSNTFARQNISSNTSCGASCQDLNNHIPQ